MFRDAIDVNRHITYPRMHLLDEGDRVVAAINNALFVDGDILAVMRLEQFRQKPLKGPIFALPFVAGRRENRVGRDNDDFIHGNVSANSEKQR